MKSRTFSFGIQLLRAFSCRVGRRSICIGRCLAVASLCASIYYAPTAYSSDPLIAKTVRKSVKENYKFGKIGIEVRMYSNLPGYHLFSLKTRSGRRLLSEKVETLADGKNGSPEVKFVQWASGYFLRINDKDRFRGYFVNPNGEIYEIPGRDYFATSDHSLILGVSNSTNSYKRQVAVFDTQSFKFLVDDELQDPIDVSDSVLPLNLKDKFAVGFTIKSKKYQKYLVVECSQRRVSWQDANEDKEFRNIVSAAKEISEDEQTKKNRVADPAEPQMSAAAEPQLESPRSSPTGSQVQDQLTASSEIQEEIAKSGLNKSGEVNDNRTGASVERNLEKSAKQDLGHSLEKSNEVVSRNNECSVAPMF
ncbi:MAG: hypothetical protein COT74_03435 [Bdellovibrionales bacterium CG10_big_fil_rev_8_21_14_0_10_45_34]|nr:MAG: hypothetical protein COT74_03435 [Bdellovibrionales bacterium CG10_big_fil_rev_8_21_14_0_10_45_34]